MSDKLIAIIVLTVTLLLPACSFKIVPIQMASVTQIERYTEHYQFRDPEHARDVLSKVVGDKNWKVIEERYVLGDVVDDLLNGKITVEGSLIFTLSLEPTNPKFFYIKGFGRYYVYRKTTNEIITSADYDIINDEPYAVDSLKDGSYMELKVHRYYTRYFAEDERTYVYNVPLTFRIYAKKVKDGIYSLDYDKKHQVLIEGVEVGKLVFQPPYKHQLIDLRGLEYLRDDY